MVNKTKVVTFNIQQEEDHDASHNTSASSVKHTPEHATIVNDHETNPNHTSTTHKITTKHKKHRIKKIEIVKTKFGWKELPWVQALKTKLRIWVEDLNFYIGLPTVINSGQTNDDFGEEWRRSTVGSECVNDMYTHM
ncbi:hypothetical protein C9374_010415 [Naegleria lovaniensis]|uniref:Uncharacterized protein n=1 Tax=Naegleria lovaniensis TaxID=51637 RepID=A0AA88GIB3_NAELO|nr:uncharacterized protein C9374_010415 [Naegleria lovaniensis]KAG2374671.1 hypothetical protein C9374_010415 [Naegleria lovaniensis]